MYVDGTLSAEEFGEDGDFVVAQVHEAQLDIFIGRMAGDFGAVGEEDHPFAVGRNVGKPVVEIVEGEFLLTGAVGVHAPDLHVAGALGVEINIFAVGGIFRSVVETGSGGEAGLVAAGGGDGVDVEVAVAAAGEGELAAIGRPAVPIGRRILRDAARHAAGDWDDVDTRSVVWLRRVADREPVLVGRNAVVVVAVNLLAGVDGRGRASGDGEAKNATVPVE